MDMFFLGNALLFFGAFALQFGLFDGSGISSDTPPEDGADLYDPGNYSGEFFGTAGDDVINGLTSPLDHAFFLGDGNDELNATFGNDYAEGGAGDDYLRMRPGDDIALGGSGNDSIDGGLGMDTLYGEDGDDAMTGNKDDDMLYGGAGNDTLTGSHGADLLDGGSGDDVLYGNFEGGEGETGDGADTLLGGEGDDTLHVAGGDIATGGAGADSFTIYDPEDSGASADITDFDPAEDVVGIIYTPELDPGTGDPVEPVLTVVANDDNTAGIVSLDGVEIASITGGQALTVDDIALIPEA